MKELAFYFKKRMKEHENVPKLWVERNYGEEIEYNIEHEIENRKNKLKSYIEKADFLDAQNNNNMNIELKTLNLYHLQKKVRKEVLINFVSDFEKQSQIYYSDILFQKTLLDRRFYKRLNPNLNSNKKDQKINDRFEQQLRNGYETRKRNKHRDYLAEILQHQKDFIEFHKRKIQTLKKRSQQSRSYLDSKEKKEQMQKDKLEKERILYLKRNDMEEYIKLLKETKDTRLLEFMSQTDKFLKEIEEKVKIQKEVIKVIKKKEETQEEEKKDVEMNEGEEEESLREQEQKLLNNYYTSAHSIVEEIKEQPKMLEGGQLKIYQLVGLQWLVSLYINNLNGILADEMGLGKTIQAIALICYIIEFKRNDGPFLIVVPLSTISNWVLEFHKWAPKIKLVVYKGSPNNRKQISQHLKNEKYNVVLTTYEYIMKDKFILNKIVWLYIIVDEGHRMKNSKSKFTQTLGTQFQSVYRLLLTGTPLQNNLSELWALLNFLLPKIFNSCDEFEKWFNQPFNKYTNERNVDLNEEEQLLIINRLHRVLTPFLLRREKKEVEKELPGKVEFVIKVELSAWQKIIYDQIKEWGVLARDPSTGKIGNKALMNTMMQLRKICNHPYLFLDHSNFFLENIDNNVFKVSGKFELLDRMIPKLLRTGHKILIFSQMTQLMDILQMFFDFRKIKHLRLDGNTKSDERGSQMEIFNNPKSDYKVFLLSTRAGGLGLNLQAADTVIIFDSDWNPQMDLQAQDRAHRIGQKHEVKVFRLITKTKIEEEILQKAAYKKNLDEKIIKAGLFNIKSSDTERRKRLEDLLRIEKEDDEEEDEVPNDEEVNTMLARTEEEYKLFDKMDKERYESENRDEKIKEIMERIIFPDNMNLKTINYRLMKDYEVPDWIRVKKIDEKEEMMKDFGKGMRIKAKVNYKDDFDDDQLDEIFDEEESEEDGKRKRSRRSIKAYEVNNTNKRKKQASSEEYSVCSKSNNMEDDYLSKPNVIKSANNMKIMINTEFMSK
jgi:ATP-dependent helicase STH1/SNF2